MLLPSGSPTEFWQRFNFATVRKLADMYMVSVFWNRFMGCHGKNINDPEGGTIKYLMGRPFWFGNHLSYPAGYQQYFVANVATPARKHPGPDETSMGRLKQRHGEFNTASVGEFDADVVLDAKARTTSTSYTVYAKNREGVVLHFRMGCRVECQTMLIGHTTADCKNALMRPEEKATVQSVTPRDHLQSLIERRSWLRSNYRAVGENK